MALRWRWVVGGGGSVVGCRSKWWLLWLAITARNRENSRCTAVAVGEELLMVVVGGAGWWQTVAFHADTGATNSLSKG